MLLLIDGVVVVEIGCCVSFVDCDVLICLGCWLCSLFVVSVCLFVSCV